jgi:hypothetical protein
MSEDSSAPKAFLSYSWSSPEHVARVVELAEHLKHDGVRVVFDRWHLKPGQDVNMFMERSVNDPEVSRVLVLCDPTYVAKANDRSGGVGAETLIISPSVYREAEQEKFVPVLMQRGPDGQTCVPTYLDGRFFVDLSNPETEAEGYEQLLRILHGAPALQEPPLGRPPAYLLEGAVPRRTGRALAQFKDAALRNQPFLRGRLDEYLDRLKAVYAAEEVVERAPSTEHLEDNLLASIERFVPYRDEFIELVDFLGRYGTDPTLYDRLHAFFEQLAEIRRQHRPLGWQETLETENLAFIAWELFLHTVASLIRAEQFIGVSRLVAPFFVRSWNRDAGRLQSFDVLDPGFRLLDEIRLRRLGLNRYSLSVELLHERSTGMTNQFEALVEADLFLWIRATLDLEVQGFWYPRTLTYAEDYETLPLFARARSTVFFERLAPALGVRTRSELVSRLKTLPDGQFPREGRVGNSREAYAYLLGILQDELSA